MNNKNVKPYNSSNLFLFSLHDYMEILENSFSREIKVHSRFFKITYINEKVALNLLTNLDTAK